MRKTSTIAVVSLAGGLLLVAAACSSFSGAAQPAEDAGDASTPLDANGSDAPLGADGPQSAFCATHAADPDLLYCNDFEPELASSSPFGFGTPSVSDAGTVTVTSDAERRAILKVTMNAPGTSPVDLSLSQQLGAPTPKARGFQLEFDIKIAENNLPSVTLADLHLAGSPCEASFGLGAFDGATLGGTRNRDVPLKPYTAAWLHVKVALIPSPASASGFREVTTVDGQTLVDRDARASNATDVLASCGSATLRIGISEVGGGAAGNRLAIVHYDNIIVHTLE